MAKEYGKIIIEHNLTKEEARLLEQSTGDGFPVEFKIRFVSVKAVEVSAVGHNVAYITVRATA